jgi:hypothetical protein
VFRDSIDAQITAGSEFASIVRLPGGSRPPDSFVAKGHPSKYGWDSRIEFRTVEGDENKLLLRVFEKDDGTYYYANTAFALECKGRVQARRATEQEWSRGREVRLPDRLEILAPMRDRKALDDGQKFTFEGRKYKHSGKGTLFQLSPTQRRVALFGFDRESISGNYNMDPFTYFVEIYDIASGKLIASARGYVKSLHIDMGTIGGELNWITDRYFYMPLSGEHDKLLFFDFGIEKNQEEKK